MTAAKHRNRGRKWPTKNATTKREQLQHSNGQKNEDDLHERGGFEYGPVGAVELSEAPAAIVGVPLLGRLHEVSFLEGIEGHVSAAVACEGCLAVLLLPGFAEIQLVAKVVKLHDF